MALEAIREIVGGFGSGDEGLVGPAADDRYAGDAIRDAALRLGRGKPAQRTPPRPSRADRCRGKNRLIIKTQSPITIVTEERRFFAYPEYINHGARPEIDRVWGRSSSCDACSPSPFLCSDLSLTLAWRLLRRPILWSFPVWGRKIRPREPPLRLPHGRMAPTAAVSSSSSSPADPSHRLNRGPSILPGLPRRRRKPCRCASSPRSFRRAWKLNRRSRLNRAANTAVRRSTTPAERPGTIIIDTPHKFLFLVPPNRRAIRYGIGVGRPGFEWSGVKTISRKAEWPDWTPPPEMMLRRPDLPAHMAGGPDNPLGARALYLGSSMYRIHGTNEPSTIGQEHLLGLHPHDERGRDRPLWPGRRRHEGHRDLNLIRSRLAPSEAASLCQVSQLLLSEPPPSS